MSEENRVSLLWSCAQELSTQTHAERLLKSYYINTSRKQAKHNVQLPEDCVGPGRMCVRCGNQWSDGNYQLQLQPQRLANNAKRRRLIAQLDAIKAKQQPKGSGRLSTGGRKRAKWLKKRMLSSVSVDCAVCKHKTTLPLEKPKKRTKSAATTIETTSATTTTTTTTVPEPAKKKKKKQQSSNNNNSNTNKDVNAGLKLAKPQKQQQTTPTAPTKTPTTTTTAVKPTTAAKSNKQKKKKSKAAQSQSQSKSTPKHAAAVKVQSKTQKQNALLQLAAQLSKSHATKNASKTQQNRLQAFLK